MEVLKSEFERYIKETLDISAKLISWEGENRLPFFLRSLYRFFRVCLLDIPCLVMACREEAEGTPAAVRKQILQVRKQWEGPVIYGARKISAYNRRRLIEHKVAFVVPGNQMYLPSLGIDLREHFKAIRKSRSTDWPPSTQMVFLYALKGQDGQGLIPKDLAHRLGYSAMTMTRAFDDLESAELGQVTKEGKQRVLRLDSDRKNVWEKALEYLRSPVQKRIWVKSFARLGVAAGLTALARHSDLTEPSIPIFSVGKDEADSINRATELLVPEPESFELEIWRYSPGPLAENGVADRFSLYLSLMDTDDERVAMALEEMMEQVRW